VSFARLSAIALTNQKIPLLSVNAVRTRTNQSATGEKTPKGSREHMMTKIMNRFVDDESGATAIEYGLIAAGISVAIITVVNTLGSQLKSTFTNISSQLATAGK
jgi:pilus assembly protein Flp/PilA